MVESRQRWGTGHLDENGLSSFRQLLFVENGVGPNCRSVFFSEAYIRMSGSYGCYPAWTRSKGRVCYRHAKTGRWADEPKGYCKYNTKTNRCQVADDYFYRKKDDWDTDDVTKFTALWEEPETFKGNVATPADGSQSFTLGELIDTLNALGREIGFEVESPVKTICTRSDGSKFFFHCP
jgi:hypothetical protein